MDNFDNLHEKIPQVLRDYNIDTSTIKEIDACDGQRYWVRVDIFKIKWGMSNIKDSIYFCICADDDNVDNYYTECGDFIGPCEIRTEFETAVLTKLRDTLDSIFVTFK